MNTQLSNHPAPTQYRKDTNYTPQLFKTNYCFTTDPTTSFEKLNSIRKLQADAFALSNRAIIDWFECTRLTYKEKADEMNKLGMRAQNGA